MFDGITSIPYFCGSFLTNHVQINLLTKYSVPELLDRYACILRINLHLPSNMLSSSVYQLDARSSFRTLFIRFSGKKCNRKINCCRSQLPECLEKVPPHGSGYARDSRISYQIGDDFGESSDLLAGSADIFVARFVNRHYNLRPLSLAFRRSGGVGSFRV